MTKIEGYAMDSEKKLPIYNSRVIFENNETGARYEVPTDERGMFKIEIPEGTYTIVLLSQLYNTVTLKDVKIEGPAQELTFKSTSAVLKR